MSLDKSNLAKLHEKRYLVSWKADGTRYLMLVLGNQGVFMVGRDNTVCMYLCGIAELHFPWALHCMWFVEICVALFAFRRNQLGRFRVSLSLSFLYCERIAARLCRFRLGYESIILMSVTVALPRLQFHWPGQSATPVNVPGIYFPTAEDPNQLLDNTLIDGVC